MVNDFETRRLPAAKADGLPRTFVAEDNPALLVDVGPKGMLEYTVPEGVPVPDNDKYVEVPEADVNSFCAVTSRLILNKVKDRKIRTRLKAISHNCTTDEDDRKAGAAPICTVQVSEQEK